MELPGTGYLYTLATVSITFVGFSALLFIYRQTVGGEVTKYDSYFLLSFIQAGFIVTGGALLPPLLALCDLAPAEAWRLASILAAFPIFLFVATVPGRRHAAAHERIPRYLVLLLALQGLCAILLVVNAIGRPAVPGPALYAIAITGMLFTTAIAYLRALALSMQEPSLRT